MKRLISWIACITAALCLPNLAWGNSETESAWVRGNVYAVSPDGGLELVVLPAWILSRDHVLSIKYLSVSELEIEYVTKQHRIAKEKIPMPADMLQAQERLERSHKLPEIVLKYLTSRTTRTVQCMIENGGTVSMLIEEKEAEIQKIHLQGISLQSMVPEVCTLLPGDGKIAVIFHRDASDSAYYYLASFEASSGQLCSEIVPIDDEILKTSLLWIDDSTLASTAVGNCRGLWSILSLTTGRTLAFGSEKGWISNFIILPDGLFLTEIGEKTLKCVYRIRTRGGE